MFASMSESVNDSTRVQTCVSVSVTENASVSESVCDCERV